MPPSEPAEVRIPKIGAKSSLVPLGLNPDETVEVSKKSYDAGGCVPKEPLTSPGFAAPLEFHGGNLGRITGSTKVITTPGAYEVAWQCANRPERGVKAADRQAQGGAGHRRRRHGVTMITVRPRFC